MTKRISSTAVIALSLCAWLPSSGSAARAQAAAQQAGAGNVKTEARMTARATGTFEVKLTPQASEEAGEGITLSRTSIDKQFHGDLEATSHVEMLAAGTAVKGSAGYVAIEHVRGKLHGRGGAFVLQHSGTMTRGVPQLTITVVPDSGTGQLAGLAGKFDVQINGGQHSYVFDYTLPETR
jgi:hypothetical protein